MENSRILNRKKRRFFRPDLLTSVIFGFGTAIFLKIALALHEPHRGIWSNLDVLASIIALPATILLEVTGFLHTGYMSSDQAKREASMLLVASALINGIVGFILARFLAIDAHRKRDNSPD